MKVHLISLLLILGLASKLGEASSQGIYIVVGIPPISGITNSLKSEMDSIDLILPIGTDPHTFDLSPSILEKLSRADIFLHTRFPFELKTAKALEQIRTKVECLDVTHGVKWRRITYQDNHHTHNDTEDTGLDLHCWLSPENIKIIAKNIFEELVRKNKANAPEYEKNYLRFLKRVDEVDQKVKRQLEPYKGKKFYVYHPAFGYFADTYYLQEVYIEVEGMSPSIREIKKTIDKAKLEGVKTIYIQPQFDRKPADAIAEAIGGKVEVLNDLGEDVLQTLMDTADKLSTEFASRVSQNQ
ncbi:MAG: zinc ABC transporter substrate-binding protein [Candidatus Hydrogenedentes bacterium]|nr:zinc ABC transporter substrate-binding protein [Candidatus Hydrogenedentota bacterium]